MFDASKPETVEGLRFQGEVLRALTETGTLSLSTRERYRLRGYREKEINRIEQYEGDIFVVDYLIYLEAKMSPRYRDTIAVSIEQLVLFTGPNKYYVIRDDDGSQKYYTTQQVAAGAREISGAPFHVFNHAEIQPMAFTAARFIELIRQKLSI